MKFKLSITTTVGLVGGVACVAIAISQAGNLGLFVNVPSLFIIVGGTVFAIIASFPSATLKTLGSVIKQSFVRENLDLERDIETIVQIAEQARREGILSIEELAMSCDDQFLKRGLMMLVDGHGKEDIEDTMVNVVYQMQKRHRKGYAMVNMIASLAPALGLVGTYVGLIPMLVSLDDPTKLGPLMAIELVSSFYGAFLAYVIFSPMGRKLMIKSEQEKDRNELLLEGILSICDGKNPRILREDLQAYLTKKDALHVAVRKPKNGEPAGKPVETVIQSRQTASERSA